MPMENLPRKGKRKMGIDTSVTSALELKIREELIEHLLKIGFICDEKGNLCPPSQEKEVLRCMHLFQRQSKIENKEDFLYEKWGKLSTYLANGKDVVPSAIKPRLDLIEKEQWKKDLFNLATLYWSVPVSNGYGRRMRYLIWDESNGKLIGIAALGDPVFNLKVRDDFIGWDSEDRKERLVNVMDAYVLGALPPYNYLLCGKLIACLLRSEEVVTHFTGRYGNKKGIISQKNKNPRLALITTTSALGRSSVYNRLKLDGQHYFRSVGYTKGWGHFHVPDEIFQLMCIYLEKNGYDYGKTYSFGQGPNWKMRVIKKCMNLIGLNDEILKHGIKREVFVSCVADNACAYLRGEDYSVKYVTLLSTDEISELALKRWIIPRAKRNNDYREWEKKNFLKYLDLLEPKCEKENLWAGVIGL